MSRMFERFNRDQLATGMFALAPGPEYAEIMGDAGLDFLIVDMMVTYFDWETVANMVRACRLTGCTPFVRLQAYPWDGHFDPTGASAALRAWATGTQGIIMSVDSPEMLASLLPLAKEAHSTTYLMGPAEQGKDHAARVKKLESERMIVPLIESAGAVKRYKEILSVPGLKAVFIGTGDLSAILGHPGNPWHDDVRKFITEHIALAKAKNIRTFVSMGRQYPVAPLVDKVQWLRSQGADAVTVPYYTFTIGAYYKDVFKTLQTNIPKDYPPLT